MNVLATQFTLELKSLDIYLAGCNGNPHCEGCHNPESWEFNQGTKYDKEYFTTVIKQKIEEFDSLIDNIMIFGGEPNDQDLEEVLSLLLHLETLGKKIWMFTRYEIDAEPPFEKVLCDYIKTGPYIPALRTDNNICYGVKLATSNQKIHKKGVDY